MLQNLISNALKFTDTGGEWVGYVGSDTKYLPLTPEALATLMRLANIQTLPPPPSRPWSTSTLIWLTIGIIAVFCALFKRVMQHSARNSAVDGLGAEMRADDAIQQALLSRQSPQDTAAAPIANAAPSRSAPTRAAAPRGGLGEPVMGKAAFGRRR